MGMAEPPTNFCEVTKYQVLHTEHPCRLPHRRAHFREERIKQVESVQRSPQCKVSSLPPLFNRCSGRESPILRVHTKDGDRKPYACPLLKHAPDDCLTLSFLTLRGSSRRITYACFMACGRFTNTCLITYRPRRFLHDSGGGTSVYTPRVFRGCGWCFDEGDDADARPSPRSL